MPSDQPNILFIVLDTVRARSTAVDGRETTPTIAAEQKRGTTFTSAIAPTTWSLSSHASLFTGLYPTEHGATLSSQYLSSNQTTLAEELADAGYRTGIFTPNLYTSGAFNMSRGFQESSFAIREKLFEDAISVDEFALREDWGGNIELANRILAELQAGNLKNVANLLYGKVNSILGQDSGEYAFRKGWDETILNEARRFIATHAANDEPFFCFVNLLSAHGPWEYDESLLREIGISPEEYGSQEEWETVASVSENQWEHAAGECTFDERQQTMLTYLYESWVNQADTFAGQLVDELVESNVRDDTIVVLTSDHGETIAEQNVLGHVASLTEDSVRVPLVVSGPGVGGETVEEAVSLKDVFGTLLEAANVDHAAVSLFDTDSRGAALAETYGESRSSVTLDVPDRFFQHRRALFTANGSVERRLETGEVFGDTSLLPQLDAMVEHLDDDRSEERNEELNSTVTDRLEQLGYIADRSE